MNEHDREDLDFSIEQILARVQSMPEEVREEVYSMFEADDNLNFELSEDCLASDLDNVTKARKSLEMAKNGLMKELGKTQLTPVDKGKLLSMLATCEFVQNIIEDIHEKKFINLGTYLRFKICMDEIATKHEYFRDKYENL